jgi:hypothetical protein
MKITKQKLKQIIKEELGKSLKEEVDSPWWVDEMDRVITEIDQLHKAIKRDHPDDLELFEDYLNQNIELTTQAWQKDRQPPAEEESEWEAETLYLSAPKEDPWEFKKRLGIGGSVHDRLGGPREKK